MILKICLEVKEIIICVKLSYIFSVCFGYCDMVSFICNSLITSQTVSRSKKKKKKQGKNKKERQFSKSFHLFLKNFVQNFGVNIRKISPEALTILQNGAFLKVYNQQKHDVDNIVVFVFVSFIGRQSQYLLKLKAFFGFYELRCFIVYCFSLGDRKEMIKVSVHRDCFCSLKMNTSIASVLIEINYTISSCTLVSNFFLFYLSRNQVNLDHLSGLKTYHFLWTCLAHQYTFCLIPFSQQLPKLKLL